MNEKTIHVRLFILTYFRCALILSFFWCRWSACCFLVLVFNLHLTSVDVFDGFFIRYYFLCFAVDLLAVTWT